MWPRTLGALVVSATTACGSRAALDQPTPRDAGPFVACDDDAQVGVRVQGFVGELEPGCVPATSQNPQVCWLGQSTCWSQQGLGPADYTLYGLPNEEIVLRTTTDGNVPRLEGVHPFGCALQAYGFFLPTPAYTAQVLAPVGGFDANKAYLLVFAEAHPGTNGGVCSGNLAGLVVTSDSGAVLYLDATASAIDTSLTATTEAGLALVVLDSAPSLGSVPRVVRVSAHRDGAYPKCTMLTGVQWQRGDPTSQTDFIADAPALAGHFTYAMYVSCGAI
jgi:hypothetical protein